MFCNETGGGMSVPPKPKFTKEEFVNAALELVGERGIEALTARELGERLGSSSRPIFTAFKNMEELTEEVRMAAMRRFEEFVGGTEEEEPSLKSFGFRMVLFAESEPKLFRFLFMKADDSVKNFDSLFSSLGVTAGLSVQKTKEKYSLSEEEAKTLFEQTWIYTFGIAVMCAAGVCRFSNDEIERLLSADFQSKLRLVKASEEPKKNSEEEN